MLAVSSTVETSAVVYLYRRRGDALLCVHGKGAVTPTAPDDQSLVKLTPPASSPLTNPWVFSKHPISGGITAQYVTDSGSGAQHQSRFFYVPSVRVFAWIPNGTGAVELIKP
jgi:hypothetical protein